MKVKDLIEKLQKVDPEMMVFCASTQGEYEYCIVNNAQTMGLRLDTGEEPDFDPNVDECETDCFVISEE